jgi:hypothetical protein
MKDELLGHKNAVCCMTEANEYLYSGSYDLTIKNWNVEDMMMRIKIRDQLRIEEEYSLKAETYNAAMDAKKKKKKRSKSPSKPSKAKAEALKKAAAPAASNIEGLASSIKKEAIIAAPKADPPPQPPVQNTQMEEAQNFKKKKK